MIGLKGEAMLQPDLRTRDGCIHYVEHLVLPQLIRNMAKQGDIPPHGMVFGTCFEGKDLPNPRTIAVGHQGMTFAMLRQAMTHVVSESKAIGSMAIRHDSFKMREGKSCEVMVVQLEHQNFPDLVWRAFMPRKARDYASTTLVFVGPEPFDQSEVEVQPLRFLANRWMS